MDIRKFVLSYYENATGELYVDALENPKNALQLHQHAYFQIYFVAKGSLIHHIDSRSAELSSGDVFILPPNTPHYITVTGRPLLFYSVSFLPSFIEKERKFNRLADDFLHALVSDKPHRIHAKLNLPHNELLFTEEIFKRIGKEFKEKQTGYEDFIRACLFSLITLFARIYLEENPEAMTLEWKKQTALHCIEYLHNHYDEPITLEDMEKRFAMSKTSFCALFTSVTGMPFKEYLNTYRVKKAASLLREGEKPGIVASMCGFGDFSTFYRNFVKKMSLSPSAYQKQHRG